MNIRIAMGIVALASVLGCSTPHNVHVTQPATPPAPLLDLAPGRELHEGQLVPGVLLPPKVCKLGTSCLAMDSRPFEPCLLSTKHCSDKAAEPLLVAPTPSLIPAPQAVVSR